MGLEPAVNPFLRRAERTITLRVAGNTRGKSRPKFNSFTKQAFTPAANIISENDVRAVWREAGEPRIEDDTAIGVEISIIVKRPAGHFKKNGQLSAEGERNPIPRTRKPDVDNALKLVMDALNSRAYHDDVRVASARVDRRWGEWPEATIKLYPIP